MSGRVPAGAPAHRYLLVESQAPQGSRPAGRFLRDALHLAADGHSVVLLLIEDGVVAAVRGSSTDAQQLQRNGGTVWVDAFSMDQRAIDRDDLSRGMEVVTMHDVAAKMLEPAVRPVWH